MTLATQTEHASSQRVRALVTAALLAALAAALGPLALPVGPVPITFQTFFVVLAALLLPAPWAAGSMALYLALGAAGLPVFAKGAAGVAVVTGPTGGYIVGFIVAAGVASLVRTGLVKTGAASLAADVGGCIVLFTIVYGMGTAWLAYSLNMSLAQAAAVGVVPFIVGDAVKAGVAIVIAQAVRRAGVRF
jgi:biotin transport system substrate-specific component